MSTSDGGIAIIGMSCVFPGGATLEQYWQNLCSGRCSIRRFGDDELRAAGISDAQIEHPQYVKAKGVIDDAAVFDAEFFRMTPLEARTTDPQDRLLLQAAWDVLNQAGYQGEPDGQRIGVFSAKSALADYFYRYVLGQPDLVNQFGEYQLHLRSAPDFLSTRISYKLNLTGPSFTIQSACSSSLAVVISACQNLLDGQCDMAVAGAASLTFPFNQGYVYQDGGVMSRDGICRPFSDGADGTVPGDGIAAVLLKREVDAVRDGDPMYAVIRGYGLNNDGADKVGYAAPSARGQASAIGDALAMAGFAPDTLGYIETHGTGTALGDPIEFLGLQRAFGDIVQRRVCALGAVKANIGHLGPVAGLAALIKTALVLSRKQCPPLINFQGPSPHCDFENSPFYVNTALQPWPESVRPRRAGVSCFGIGGTNGHVMLEEAAVQPKTHRQAAVCHNLVLSAHSSESLSKMRDRLKQYLCSNPDVALQDVAYTLQYKRKPYPYRTCLVGQDRADLAAQFDAPLGMEKALAHAPTSLVFMFPGQGCQYAGMSKTLYETYPPFRAALDSCCEIYRAAYGADLRGIMFHADQSAALRQTRYVQPALFALEYALARLLISWGFQPSAVIGHSLGEYVAATIAGVLLLSDAVHLVGLRGRLMQTLPPGNMLACFAPADRVQSLMPRDCDLAVVNSATQCVVAGPTGPINSLKQTLEQQGVSCRLLDSDKAFHSAATEAICQDFVNGFGTVTFAPPQLDYVSNLSGDYMTAAPDADYWAKHMRHCVEFHQGLTTLLQQPDHVFIEVGPGSTLTALVKQHEEEYTARACTALLPGASGKENEINCLHRGLGRLWQQGYRLNWQSFQGNGHTLPLPGYAFGGKAYFVEAKQQKPAETAAAEELQQVDDPVVVMTRIWQQHLGYDLIEPDHDFYDLGGDSLLAIGMIAHINRALGSKLYAHDLLQAPTIEKLSRVLVRKGGKGPFCLVTLNQGEGTKVPLFLLHAIGGGVQYLKDLTAHLAESQPVYGLQAQGLDGTTDPNVSLVDMARHYLGIIRSVCARGPYLLGGHSFGGLLAYEIATQLRQQGETVALLCLMDTPGFDRMPVRLSDDVDILHSMAILFEDDPGQCALDRAALQRLSGEARLAYFLTHVGNSYLKRMSCDDLALLLKVFKANTNAMFDYRPTPQPELSITFFKALVRDAITADHPEQGWQVHLGKERVEVHLVAGTHHTMMENPHVRAIADVISQKIAILSPGRRERSHAE